MSSEGEEEKVMIPKKINKKNYVNFDHTTNLKEKIIILHQKFSINVLEYTESDLIKLPYFESERPIFFEDNNIIKVNAINDNNELIVKFDNKKNIKVVYKDPTISWKYKGSCFVDKNFIQIKTEFIFNKNLEPGNYIINNSYEEIKIILNEKTNYYIHNTIKYEYSSCHQFDISIDDYQDKIEISKLIINFIASVNMPSFECELYFNYIYIKNFIFPEQVFGKNINLYLDDNYKLRLKIIKQNKEGPFLLEKFVKNNINKEFYQKMIELKYFIEDNSIKTIFLNINKDKDMIIIDQEKLGCVEFENYYQFKFEIDNIIEKIRYTYHYK